METWQQQQKEQKAEQSHLQAGTGTVCKTGNGHGYVLSEPGLSGMFSPA